MGIFSKKKSATKPASDENQASDNVDKCANTDKTGIKHRIITKGKDTALNFVISKVFGFIFSAILSAALVLYTQHSFKDNFKDYVKNYVSVHIEDFTELIKHSDALADMDYVEAEQYCKENNIYEKSKELLKVAISYTSDDEDINMIHSCFVSVCEDLLDLSTMMYASTGVVVDNEGSDEVSDDLIALSDKIRDASANMSVMSPGDDAFSNQSDPEDDNNDTTPESIQYENAVIKLKAKLEIFIDLSNELCIKHKIDPFI